MFGGHMKDESFEMKHTRAGLLSMANSGPDRNGSQFFITFAPLTHLNGKHVVFGEVVEGMNVLREIEKVETGPKDRPVSLEQVLIRDCGQLAGTKNFSTTIDAELLPNSNLSSRS